MEPILVNYEMFGAVGDGKTDDLEAIVAAHEYANAHHLPVKTRDEAVYYIGGKALTAIVKTPVDFGKSHFIIDDTQLEDIKSHLFLVQSESVPVTFQVEKLESKEDILPIPSELQGAKGYYAKIEGDYHKVFIRKGLNMNNGVSQSDSFLVDAEGHIGTDLNWIYDQPSTVSIRPLDEEPLTIQGGIFTTIANVQDSFYNYHHRGIQVERDHVTVQNVTHYVEGEKDHGAPYRGFLSVELCAYVTLKDCLLTPHFTYWTISKIPGQMVPMGSYDINAAGAIHLKMEKITQTIDIMDSRFWGLMGTNFCKDMEMTDCVVSRFDAHMGVTNLYVARCRLGHMCFNLIGKGDVLVEDTEAFGASFINLRSDYGSSFTGTLTLKNNVWKPKKNSKQAILNALNEGDHDFGYISTMPEKLIIDGLTIMDEGMESSAPSVYILPDYDPTFEPGKPFAYETVKELDTKGIVTQSGRPIEICQRKEEYPYLFSC